MANAAIEASVPEKESFAALLDESLGQADRLEGTVLRGTVIAIENFGAGDIVEIRKPDGSEFMVPMKAVTASATEIRRRDSSE